MRGCGGECETRSWGWAWPNEGNLSCVTHAAVQLLNQMVQYSHARCDATFAALSDATRRGVVEALMRQDASISDLAQRFDMTLTGMKKHVGVLEQAGLVRTVKQGRVKPLKPRAAQHRLPSAGRGGAAAADRRACAPERGRRRRFFLPRVRAPRVTLRRLR